nr:asparagine synthetase B [Candidatus Paceibacterota bacterium]
MCGIAGIVSTKIHEADLLERMLSRIAHRGPEYQGVWSNEDKTVLLGHRRLAIIDLSPTGRQPMQRERGRFTITFNGEIYNYQELKKELEQKGATFNTASDTEVILAAYQQWGMACVKRIHGMFAFAIWDDVTKKLFAARDRIGEKPFKYWYHNGTLVFASEIKALLEYPHIPRQINWDMIDIALSVRFIPSPETGFIGIHKLPPAHTLLWEKGALTI